MPDQTGGRRPQTVTEWLRHFASMPAAEVTAVVADTDNQLERLRGAIDPDGELDRVLATLRDDGGETDRMLAALAAENDAELKPMLRRLRRQERLDSQGLAETIRRFERGDPAADRAEDAAAALELTRFLDWQRAGRPAGGDPPPLDRGPA
jgi:hypothetical protein